MAKPRLRAYVDESSVIRESMKEYRVCAVVVTDEVADEIRAKLLPFLLKGQRKFHWIAEKKQRRQAFLTTICGLNLDAIIVIDRSTPQRNEERRRRKALELLYLTLENLGVADVVLESRTSTQDHMDIKHIAGLKSAGLFTSSNDPRARWRRTLVVDFRYSAGRRERGSER